MVMKKFINNPEDVARELTRGLVKAYSNYLKLVGNDIMIRTKPKEKGNGQSRVRQSRGTRNLEPERSE